MIIGPPGIQKPIRLLMRIPVPWVFVLTYLVGVSLEYVIPLKVHPEASLNITVFGGVLFCIGAVVAGWSWVIFHRAGTTRVPGEPSTTLVTGGPYCASRNPMYLGLALAYLGEAGMLRQVWPVLLLPLTVAYLNWIVIPVEEARLQEVFQSEYDEYRAGVRRWIGRRLQIGRHLNNGRTK
jgi:protein-S-isoprenylcysteine O-methyltransferase Ste14